MLELDYARPKVSACSRWLEVDLGRPHATVGWTLIGGGREQAKSAFWHRVSDADLLPESMQSYSLRIDASS
jgi:hypothetical protein